jgi:peptidoglycan/xylan/chitin deacetylase (PgdA/CDA1 family)
LHKFEVSIFYYGYKRQIDSMKKKKQPKIVYLTFDDGIENGTLEVLNILEKRSVTATFFITGINTYYNYTINKQLCRKALSNILRHHSLGNHSYSHANGFYSSYYQKGLLVDNNGTRITVQEDFLRNENFLNSLINENKEILSDTTSLFSKIARLPGRNSWYLSCQKFIAPKTGVPKGSEQKPYIFTKIDSDSYNAAHDLFRANYQVFGWDEEWRMSFDFARETIAFKDSLIKRDAIDYSSPEHSFPYYDMNAAENIHKDRLSEPWMAVGKRIVNSPLSDIVLLMHDRAFRSNSLRQESYQLDMLIQFLNEEGIIFKSINEYFKTPISI